MRPLLAADAFVRTYVGERGWGHILVRRARGPRLWLNRLERSVADLANGFRTAEEIAEAAGPLLGRKPTVGQVAATIEFLLESGAVFDADNPPDEQPQPPSSPGIVNVRLDAATAGAMKSSVVPGVGFTCDGRGGCCKLYDLVMLRSSDIAALEVAYGTERHLPGGLTVPSAIYRHRFDAETEQFALAACDGACVVLEPDGKCGVHRLVGFERKPSGCAAYPIHDVLCGDELAVGVGVECRCAVELSEGNLDTEAEQLLRRRKQSRSVEAVVASVPIALDRTVPRAQYVAWRAAARERLGAAKDMVAWAIDEARRLTESPEQAATRQPQSVASFVSGLAPVARELVEYLSYEARNTAEVYSSNDLQVLLYAWSYEAALKLFHAAEAGREPGPPVSGEELLASQSLHTHDLLRANDLQNGLLSLAVRLLLARGGDGSLPSALLPVTVVQYLGRSSHVGRMLQDTAGLLTSAVNRAG